MALFNANLSQHHPALLRYGRYGRVVDYLDIRGTVQQNYCGVCFLKPASLVIGVVVIREAPCWRIIGSACGTYTTLVTACRVVMAHRRKRLIGSFSAPVACLRAERRCNWPQTIRANHLQSRTPRVPKELLWFCFQPCKCTLPPPSPDDQPVYAPFKPSISVSSFL